MFWIFSILFESATFPNTLSAYLKIFLKTEKKVFFFLKINKNLKIFLAKEFFGYLAGTANSPPPRTASLLIRKILTDVLIWGTHTWKILGTGISKDPVLPEVFFDWRVWSLFGDNFFYIYVTKKWPNSAVKKILSTRISNPNTGNRIYLNMKKTNLWDLNKVKFPILLTFSFQIFFQGIIKFFLLKSLKK